MYTFIYIYIYIYIYIHKNSKFKGRMRDGSERRSNAMFHQFGKKKRLKV